MKDLGNVLSGDQGTSTAGEPDIRPTDSPPIRKGNDYSQLLANTSSGITAFSQISAGFEKANLLEGQAEQLDFQAKQEGLIGTAEEINAKQNLNRTLAQVLVTSGASGVSMSGSPGVTAAQVVKDGDFQIGLIKRQTALKQAGLERAARNKRNAKGAAKAGGFLKAAQTGIQLYMATQGRG